MADNVHDCKEQMQEMMYYYNLLHAHGLAGSPEDICRDWIRRYARKWRELKNKGIVPQGILRNEYQEVLQQEHAMAEDQYKWASGRMRRSQSFFRSSFGKSRSFGNTLAEKLEMILRP